MLETAASDNLPQDDLQHLTQQIGDLESMLRAQHTLLRQRGMTLPLGVLDQLAHLRNSLIALVPQLAAENTELDQLRALAKTMGLINSSLDSDEVLTEVMDTAIALTRAERGYIMLRSSQTGEMQFRIARNRKRQAVSENDLTVSRTIMTEAVETGQPVVLQNALLNSHYDSQQSIILHAPRSVICVPLIFKNQITGVLYADNRHISDLFGEKEVSLLVAFANQAAIAIENARLFTRVKRALVESTAMKDLMDNVFASIASGVITTDIHNRIITYNQAAEQILGVSNKNAIDQPIQSVLPNVFEGFNTLVQRMHEEDRQHMIEIEPVLPARGAVNLNLKLTSLKDAQGVTYGMALVIDDLTEIKQRDATLNVVRTYLPPSLVHNIIDIDSLGLSGDEREVSIIFADVRGFTTFSEQLDPQQLMEVISQYLTVSSDAIELYNGIIDKYMGDAVVGLFNTQLNPQADHAVRAVRAALSMTYDIRALHDTLPPAQRLFYGIGVTTGVAILGNVGSPSRKAFTAIGQPFDRAKLLQENALPGELIISQSTYDRVQDLFIVEALEPRKVKGLTDFHTMYRVTDIKRDKP